MSQEPEAQSQEGDLEEELAEKEEEYKPTPRVSAFLDSDKILDAEFMEVDPAYFKWKVFLAGPSGSGKTTAAAMTLPGKKLLVDFDGRSDSVAGMKDVKIYPCTEPEPRSPIAWRKADQLRKVIVSEVKQGIFPFDTILFDGATMLGRMCMNWSLTLDSKRGLGGSPAKQHYGPQMDSLSKYMLSTLALPLNICWTGHIELFEEEATGKHRFYPKITGKLKTELSNWFNETYNCYRLPDKNGILRYYWQTGGSGTAEFFKSSLNSLGRFWKDPIMIDFDKEKAGFADLFHRRFVIGEMKPEEKGGEKKD